MDINVNGKVFKDISKDNKPKLSNSDFAKVAKAESEKAKKENKNA